MRKLTLFLIAALSWSAAQAQIVFPPAAPLPTPVPISPASGATLKGSSPNLTAIQFRWSENGVFSTPTQPLPSHFVLCIKPTAGAACTFAPANFLPVGSLTSSALFNNGHAIGWQYTYTTPAGSIVDSLLNVDATWSVGACRNAVATNCVFSAARPLYISSVDLSPFNISNDSTSTNAVFTAKANNNGSTTVPSIPFKSVIFAWDAIVNPATGRCEKNINRADLINNADVLVFMDNGANRWLTTLPMSGGSRVAPALVVGMAFFNNGLGVRGDEDEFGPSLPGGAVGDVAKISFPLPAAQRPKPFVVTMRPDSTYLVREYDEDNNPGAGCEYVP